MKPHRAQNRRLNRQRDGARIRLDPHTTERRQPMEILAKLAGRSNFVIRSDTPSSKGEPITALDVAFALACSTERLGIAVGLAVAYQRAIEWPLVHELGYPRLLADLLEQRERPGIVDGHRVFRARIGLHDAFHQMVTPRRDQTLRDAAKMARCNFATYEFILHRSLALLEHAGNTAASDACRFLFAREDGAEPVAIALDNEGNTLVWHRDKPLDRTDDTSFSRATNENDLIELLMQDITAAQRKRITGVLVLAPKPQLAHT